MEQTAVQKLAKVLKVLITAAFFCNLLVLPLVSVLVVVGSSGLGTFAFLVQAFEDLGGLSWLWQVGTYAWTEPYESVLSAFLLFCGSCTAIVLWQARRVLNTMLTGEPFCMENAGNMKRAAVCCFLISGAALARTVWGCVYYGSPASLFTYNALFCPIALMGGLLCRVMSALFRQAAELKAENDLTI